LSEIYFIQLETLPVNHPSYFQITANKMQRFLIYLFLETLYMFQTVPPPVIRST